MSEFFQVGPHTHINGDSTKAENYVKALSGKKANMLFADPPYCLLVRRNKKTGQLRDPKVAKINHEAVKRYENVREYREFTKKWMTPACANIKDDGIFIIWTNFLGKAPIKQVAKDIGLDFFHGEFMWGKLSKESNGNEALARMYEVALIFSKTAPKENLNEDSYIPWSVITKYDEEGEAGTWENHPNHKPFSSLEPLIRAYTNVGDLILDPFTGSGSTPAAAIKLGRSISGIELRAHWADISQNRIKAHFEA
jgi:site-specific DNA-methyltransferase (adenine-specific)